MKEKNMNNSYEVLDPSNFASVHNHSYFSLLDSIMSPEEVVEQAHKLGYKAVAISEHGNFHSFIRGYKKAQELGIKYIFGCEVYETTDMDNKTPSSDRYHLLLLAKNEVGLQNLFKIVSESSTRGFYQKPRIDLKTIAKYSEGIIATSACLASRLMRLLTHGFCPCCSQGNFQHKETCKISEKLNGNETVQFEKIDMDGKVEYVEFQPKWDEARKVLQEYIDVFGDDFYIELQSHGTNDQMIGNQRILQLAKETNTKTIITFDSHMANGDKETLDIHRKFIQIAQNGREVGETYADCFQQSMDYMYNVLVPQIGIEAVNEAVINTGELADKCNVELDLNKGVLMPHAKIPEGFDNPTEYLKYLINVGWKKRGVNTFSQEKKQQYRERILQELDVLEYLDYVGYFLILHQMTSEFRKHGIPLGYSRGSGAGCLILWLIGVTEIDSIRWDLDFSRFANKGRKAIADYDLDTSKRKRGLALELTEEMFGKENVSHLCTFNSLSPKVAIKDLGKVFNEEKIYDIPYAVRDKISQLIPDKTSIEEALESSSELRKYEEKYPKLFRYASVIQNFPKSVGCHASAIIISDTPIINHAPVMLNKDGRIMLQVDMSHAEPDLGLVKFDFLGLISLDTVQDTLDLSGLTWKDIDLQYLDQTGKLDDKDVLHEVYSKGNTLGVFQMESYVAQNLFKDMYSGISKESYDVEDVIAVNAMNRPAVLSVGMHNNYIQGKRDPKTIKYMHEDLIPIFGKTNGIMLYQEQALSVFRLAGFPPEEVDNARRAIGKKKPEVMAKLFTEFEEGLLKRGWRKDTIEDVWKLVEAQAGYSFNRSHSVAYGLLSYVMAYLKHYHPVEFMTALLISEIGDYEQTSKYIDACNEMNIKVLPPDINKATHDYTVVEENGNKKIMFGLASLKGVGNSSSDLIMEVRNNGKIYDDGVVVPSGDFKDLHDFICRCRIDKTSIISLIKAGAFGSNKVKLLEEYAEALYVPTKLKLPTTCPSKATLVSIGVVSERDYNKDNRDKYFQDYLKIKKDKWKEVESARKEKHMNDFKEKYMSDPEMYEYETMSIFLNGSPFTKYKTLLVPFEDFEDGQDKILIGGTITDIQRKKQKGGGLYAYIHLLTLEGIYEGIVFKGQYQDYQDLIKKGSNVVCLAKKSGSQFIVSKMRTLDSWKRFADKKVQLQLVDA